MEKKNRIKACLLSLPFVICFFINTLLDYRRYISEFDSAPFYLQIIMNAICYLVPAIIVLVIGLAYAKK